MSTVTLAEIKEYLNVIHSGDDSKLQRLIDQAEDECLRFLNRTQPPTLPVDFPPEYDSDSSEIPEDVPSSEDPVAASFARAVYLLVQGAYEGTPDDMQKMRQAAEVVLFPYRTNLGV